MAADAAPCGQFVMPAPARQYCYRIKTLAYESSLVNARNFDEAVYQLAQIQHGKSVAWVRFWTQKRMDANGRWGYALPGRNRKVPY